MNATSSKDSRAWPKAHNQQHYNDAAASNAIKQKKSWGVPCQWRQTGRCLLLFIAALQDLAINLAEAERAVPTHNTDSDKMWSGRSRRRSKTSGNKRLRPRQQLRSYQQTQPVIKLGPAAGLRPPASIQCISARDISHVISNKKHAVCYDRYRTNREAPPNVKSPGCKNLPRHH